MAVAHLSILFGMFAFMAMDQPWWFFSAFLVFKALMDVAGLLPKWQYQPKARTVQVRAGFRRINELMDTQSTFTEGLDA